MNILIIEDELHTANLLKEIIEQDPDFMVVEVIESVIEAVAYLGKYQRNLDLLFFDIQLADGHSFEIFKHIDINVPVVFCTAFEEYSLQAIKNNGIDYVLKPFKEEEIHTALQKYKRLIQNVQSKQAMPLLHQLEEQKSYQQHFITQFRDKSVVKAVSDIAFFSLESETVYLYNFKGEKSPLFKKMEYIESVCDPQQFFRINRQMLVNRAAIVGFEPYFNRKIVLQLQPKFGEKAIVSRLKVSSFKDWLES